MDSYKVLVYKNGVEIVNTTDPRTVILVVAENDKEDSSINEITLVSGHPKDVMTSFKHLEDHVQKQLTGSVVKMLEKDPSPKAKSLLGLIQLMDKLIDKTKPTETDCENCPVKDECDEVNKPTKGCA